MRGKIKRYQKTRSQVPCMQHCLWASSWSLSASSHQEQERVVHLILRRMWIEHMQEAGWMGDAGRGDHWMVESPDVSFRLRSLLGKPLGSAFLLHVIFTGKKKKTKKADVSTSHFRCIYSCSINHTLIMLYTILYYIAYISWPYTIFDIGLFTWKF